MVHYLWIRLIFVCRWGYKDIDETRQQVANMRQAGIPLEGKPDNLTSTWIEYSLLAIQWCGTTLNCTVSWIDHYTNIHHLTSLIQMPFVILPPIRIAFPHRRWKRLLKSLCVWYQITFLDRCSWIDNLQHASHQYCEGIAAPERPKITETICRCSYSRCSYCGCREQHWYCQSTCLLSFIRHWLFRSTTHTREEVNCATYVDCAILTLTITHIETSSSRTLTEPSMLVKCGLVTPYSLIGSPITHDDGGPNP